MTVVRNNKSSSVGLPAGDLIIQFAPGAHEYPTALIESLDMSRAAVRAYFEGDSPVLEKDPDDVARIVPNEPPKRSAKTMVHLISESVDLGMLRKISEEDERKTVVKAATERLDELQNLSVSEDGGEE